MLSAFLQHNAPAFHVRDTIRPEQLRQCKRTAFAWTRIPQTLCLAADKKYFALAVDNPNIQGIVAHPDILPPSGSTAKGIVVSEKPADLFYAIHNLGIHGPGSAPGPDTSQVAASATVDPTAWIGKHVTIEEDVVVSAHCAINDGTLIRSGTELDAGVTVGYDGFFSKDILTEKVHVKHFGGVRIGRGCWIHAGTNIARSANFGEFTEIGDRTHIGPHCTIGHDCQIAGHCDISARVLLCGRVRVRENCWIGAGATVSNALTVGQGARVRIGATVIEDVPAEGDVSGNFAIPHATNLKEFLRSRR